MNGVELKKTAVQFLRGLQQAGLSDLPAESERELAELIFETDSPEQGSPQTSTTAVAEQPTSYRQKKSTRPKPEPKSPAAKESAAPRTALFGISDAYGPSLSDEQRAQQLTQLQQTVASCTSCPQLSACRKNTVFGVGNQRPRLAFYGEGPGADEDRLGEPFVGRAGELLNKIIGACKMNREDVYIFNTVKCRPPNNRNPHDAEIQNCWNYSEQQLEILQPEFICCLGSVAAKTLLKTTESVGRMRGKFHQYRGSQVIVTYHPAYLLRTPAAKAKTWQDMQMLIEAMGISLD